MNTSKASIIFLFFLFFSIFSLTANAQFGGSGIPSTYNIFDDIIESGDIVSFNPDLNIYELSKIEKDERMFGIINETPAVVFRDSSGGIPVLNTGEAVVNVTNLNGPIIIGDMVTTSQIPGKGQKFGGSEGYILGYAIESFSVENSTGSIDIDGEQLLTGNILVMLAIGPSSNDGSVLSARSTIFVREGGEAETGLETIFRYLTAAIFTLGTVFVVIKTFGPNLSKGVVAIGRNPLAKSSIQAMVVFNVILILVISLVSFGVSLIIIFLPI